MTIEDSLKGLKVETNSEDKNQDGTVQIKEKQIKIQQDISQALENYIDDFIKYRPNDRYQTFDSKKLQVFAPYLKFLPDLSIQVGPIPKKDLINILKEKSPEFKILAEQTNITDQIQENTILLTEEFNAVLSTPEIQEALGISELSNFQRLTQKYFVIASLEFLSLFMGQGKILRRYYKSNEPGERKTILEIGEESLEKDRTYYSLAFEAEFTPLSIANLRKFCETEKITEIKDMLNNLSNLTNKLYLSVPPSSSIATADSKEYYFSKDCELMRKNLFARLKKHNPNLTAGETNVN